MDKGFPARRRVAEREPSAFNSSFPISGQFGSSPPRWRRCTNLSFRKEFAAFAKSAIQMQTN
jgi:hypothetical protein